MTAKIFRSTFLVGILTFLVCVAMFMGKLYGYFEQRVFGELESEAVFVAGGIESDGEEYLKNVSSGNRVTWVAADGKVLYDTVGDAKTMENHSGREEIRQALENGTGRSSHYSQVFMEKTLYYAVRLDDGTVARVSCTQNSVATLLLGMASPICWMLVIVLVLSAFLASRLAKRITKPINRLDLENPSLSDDMQELAPLVSKLREQNHTIAHQMEELKRREREFAAITENMAEGFILIDNRANMLSYNSSALRILDSAPGKESKSVLQLNRTEKFRTAVDSALSGQHGGALLTIDGHSYELMANPVTAAGQVTGAVLVIMDVTEREQRDALRREFTANVSHELKTPLTSISGFAELMKNGLVEPDRVAEFAGDIYDESRRLITLVEDIIKLSKLDEEAFSPEKESVDLYALSESVLSRLSGEAQKHGVTLSLEGEHVTINGVRQILDEMVYNLAENAIKYNVEGGSVTVSVKSAGAGVNIAVSDTGIGIPLDSQSRVFERFYRVDKSHSKEIGGTGLGLSIVRHGAMYHDARIELDSKPRKGTTITVMF